MHDVDVHVALGRRVRVARVREHLLHARLRAEKFVFVERVPHRQRLASRVVDRPLHPRRQRVDSANDELRRHCGSPLLDHDRDVYVLVPKDLHPPGTRVRSVVAVCSVVALDPRQVALERILIENLVVVYDATKEIEKLRARSRRELVRDVGWVELVGTPNCHIVDGGAPLRRLQTRNLADREEEQAQPERDSSRPPRRRARETSGTKPASSGESSA